MLKEYLSNIANTIRSKLGTTAPINAQDFADKVNDVYNKGFSEGDKFGFDTAFNKQMIKYEEMFTNNYQRKSYVGAFAQSDWTGYTFLNPVCPIDSVERMFYAYAGSEFPGNIDLSKLNCSKSASYYRFLFQWINDIVTIPDMGLPAIPYYTNTYANCKNLETIEVIRCNKNTIFQNPFLDSPNVKNFTIEGVIGTDFDVSHCTKLSIATCESIVDHLHDYSGSSVSYNLTVSIGTFSNISTTFGDRVAAKGWNLIVSI